jgi:hypothetical protein
MLTIKSININPKAMLGINANKCRKSIALLI